jgi:oligogalacturonide transport system substrate-binding protein
VSSKKIELEEEVFMKKLLALIMVLAFMVSMVGCSGGNSTNVNSNQGNQGSTTGTGSDEQITIRFSWWGGDARHEATQEVIRLFQEKNPNITVLPEFTAWNGHYEKIATQLIGKTEADIMQINYNWFYIFSPDGEGFYDLSTLDNLHLDNWPKETYEAITINGKVLGVPSSVGGRLLYLNKTTFDAADVPIPTTWDDYIAAGPIFQEKLGSDYYPLGNISTENDALALLTFGYLSQLTGKDIITKDNQLAFSRDELITGFEFVTKLLENKVIPYAYDDSALKDAQNPRWIDGKYGAIYEWNSSVNAFVDALNPQNNPNVVLAPYPSMEGQKATGAFNKIVMAFAISKNSKHPEIAAEFLNFMYTDKDAVIAHELQRAVPVNTVAMDILEEAGKLNGLGWEGHKLVSETNGFPYHPYYEDAEVREVYIPVFQEYLQGRMSPEDAADQIVNNFDNALETAMTR